MEGLKTLLHTMFYLLEKKMTDNKAETRHPASEQDPSCCWNSVRSRHVYPH